MLIDVESRPRGATVRLDDPSSAPLGRTPLRHVRVATGWHTIYLSLPGFTTYELRAQVVAGSTHFRVGLTMSLSVRVTSHGESALVVIDGNEVGYTPVEVGGLRAGRHAIEVRRPGSEPFRRSVVLRPGPPLEVAAE